MRDPTLIACPYCELNGVTTSHPSDFPIHIAMIEGYGVITRQELDIWFIENIRRLQAHTGTTI